MLDWNYISSVGQCKDSLYFSPWISYMPTLLRFFWITVMLCSSFYTYFVCCICARAYMEATVLLFYYVGSKDQSQVIRMGGQCFNPQNHLTGPSVMPLNSLYWGVISTSYSWPLKYTYHHFKQNSAFIYLECVCRHICVMACLWRSCDYLEVLAISTMRKSHSGHHA